MDKNETYFENLKVKNSKLEICGKDFDNITTVNPKINQKYTSNHYSDFLVDKNETGFDKLKLEILNLKYVAKILIHSEIYK